MLKIERWPYLNPYKIKTWFKGPLFIESGKLLAVAWKTLRCNSGFNKTGFIEGVVPQEAMGYVQEKPRAFLHAFTRFSKGALGWEHGRALTTGKRVLCVRRGHEGACGGTGFRLNGGFGSGGKGIAFKRFSQESGGNTLSTI